MGRGGRDIFVTYTAFHSTVLSLDIFIAATHKGICRVYMGREADFIEQLKKAYPSCILDRDAGHKYLSLVMEDLDAYFKGIPVEFQVPLHIGGTSFQMAVWKAIQDIPYGSIKTYRDIARTIGNERATRAVGQACGKNPVPLIIPCHRVVASSGRLGGYTGGVWIKKVLLDLEKGHGLKD